MCPKQVYSDGQKARPKWDECANCGLCVSACPTRCIAPSTKNLEEQFALANKGERLRISCCQAEEETEYQVSCLAAIPWEMLAYLALKRPLCLSVGICAECQYPERVEAVQRELGLLLQFLGEETFLKRVSLEFEKQEEEDPQKRWSRRGLLGEATKKTIQGAGKLLVGDNAERYDGMFYREMLADLIRERRSTEEGKTARYIVELPGFQENCYGCGNCVKLCPNQALEIGPEKDGKRSVYITPWKCTGCGV
ncbi:MAG: 4Fe-4S binding protein, partial [Lachnospiraceae bacterium]|nr:4Fe-4S binding protein [Lachnospiraceae bacterium]